MIRQALANANALQDIVFDELRPGRTGNEILAAARARMQAKKIDGTVYSIRLASTAMARAPSSGSGTIRRGSWTW